MKKISNKGFTLIELLAVITIMGILMLVAIPAVTRTIENSRRDTFADVAGEYLTAVRNAVLADEIECAYVTGSNTATWTLASALPDGTYYFPICTSSATTICKTPTQASSTVKMTATEIVNSTTDLLESGGKSPFGNADVYGYVTWTKSTRDASASASASASPSGAGDKKSTTVYKVFLQDSGKHGLDAEYESKSLKRSVILPAVTTTGTGLEKKRYDGKNVKQTKADDSAADTTVAKNFCRVA